MQYSFHILLLRKIAYCYHQLIILSIVVHIHSIVTERKYMFFAWNKEMEGLLWKKKRKDTTIQLGSLHLVLKKKKG